MRCLACNRRMTDFDCSRKTVSGSYVDLCLRCYRTIADDLPTVGNWNIMHEDDEEMDTEDIDRLEDDEYNNYEERDIEDN